MPCDPGTREYNDQELTEVLSEIQTIMNTADYDDVIFSADMNWHKGRNTGFADMVERFVETSGLVSVWDHFECDFTHMHVDLKSVSTIDHFLVNRRLIDHISCAPIHLGDNGSRHSPIMLKLKVGNIPRSAPVNVEQPRRPAWYKAKQEEWKITLSFYTTSCSGSILQNVSTCLLYTSDAADE